MKIFLFFLIIYCSFFSKLFAQSITDDKAVLLKALDIVNYEPPIVYVKKISYKKTPQKAVEKLMAGKFYEYNDSNSVALVDPVTGETTLYGQPSDSLILTESEKEFIIKNWTKSVHWKKGLFENSIRVKDVEQGLQTLRMLTKTAPATGKRAYRYVFGFGKPVFIREGTICLVAVGAICGGECGKVETSFYRKKNGRWEQWISLGGGEF